MMDESRTNSLKRDTDMFGMANSVEVLVPYLDGEVVALAAALPGNLKTDGATHKPLLVDAIVDSLIAGAARRPKRGFSFPVAKWMHERTSAMREMAMPTKFLERDVVGEMRSASEQDRLDWSRAWSSWF